MAASSAENAIERLRYLPRMVRPVVIVLSVFGLLDCRVGGWPSSPRPWSAEHGRPGPATAWVSQPGLRVLRILLLRFVRGSDGLCTPSYVVLMASSGLCKQSVANALKRLEACGIIHVTRRLVREVIDAGGFAMTVCRQASNLYAVRLFKGTRHRGPGLHRKAVMHRREANTLSPV